MPSTYLIIIYWRTIMKNDQTTSLASIQERIESRYQNQTQELIFNLQKECKYRQNAQKTAEQLIQAYQRENQQLKQQNIDLKEQLYSQQQTIRKIDLLNNQLDTYQSQLMKLTQQNSQLQDLLLRKDQQLLKVNQHLIQLNRCKVKNWNQEGRQHISNHFKKNMQHKSPTNASINMNSTVNMDGSVEEWKKENRVLHWKLKQKDEEIIMLLRRNEEMEYKFTHQEKHYNNGDGKHRYANLGNAKYL